MKRPLPAKPHTTEIPFFDTIVTIANERVVTADDFKPFVGRSNWLSFDRSEPLGADCEPFCAGIVYGFRLLGTLAHMNIVTIDIDCGDRIRRMQMTPDELAIRMEDS